MELLNHDEHACWKSISDFSKVQTERASGSWLNWRRKMDLDTFGIWVLFSDLRYQNGNLVPYWGFGPLLVFRYDIGVIGAIFGVHVMKFRHVFKGAIKLLRWYRFGGWPTVWIGLRIGWLLIWLDNKSVTVFTNKARRRLLFRAGYLASRLLRDFDAPWFSVLTLDCLAKVGFRYLTSTKTASVAANNDKEKNFDYKIARRLKWFEDLD